MSHTPPMAKWDRLQRVVILCVSFARNMAYYRAGQEEEHRHLFQRRTPGANFWIIANGNFIDICVLEWCKLFADQKGKHYWGRVVTDPTSFQAELLRRMGIDEAAYQKQLDAVRHYRDKFVAHLDDDVIMKPPWLEPAKAAVWFYHEHVVRQEAKEYDFNLLPLELDEGYKESEIEAHSVLRAAKTALPCVK